MAAVIQSGDDESEERSDREGFRRGRGAVLSEDRAAVTRGKPR